jgi:hypothetical protein
VKLMGEKLNYEQIVIDQLRGYKRIAARMKILEKQPAGYGMSIGSLYADDNLQALHTELRKMPSYMYLNAREQLIESTAHRYLTKYPYGVKAQHNEVRQLQGEDEEDEGHLRDLQRQIKKVIVARTGTADDYEAVLERISELQELEQRKQLIDHALDTLGEYKPQYCILLKLRYIDNVAIDEIVEKMNISSRSYERMRPEALKEFAKLNGIPIGIPS